MYTLVYVSKETKKTLKGGLRTLRAKLRKLKRKHENLTFSLYDKNLQICGNLVGECETCK